MESLKTFILYWIHIFWAAIQDFINSRGFIWLTLLYTFLFFVFEHLCLCIYICVHVAVFVQMIRDIINNSGYAWLPPLLHLSSLRRPRVNISNVIVINASVLNVFNVIVTNNILNVLKQSYTRSLEEPLTLTLAFVPFAFFFKRILTVHWPFRKKVIEYICVMCCLSRHVIQLFKRSPFKC